MHDESIENRSAADTMHRTLGIPIRGPIIVAIVAPASAEPFAAQSILLSLAEERSAVTKTGDLPRISVITGTTAFTPPEAANAFPMVFAASARSRSAAIEHAWGREKSVVIVGAGRNGIDGLRAVDPDWPQQAMEMDIVEFVGVETGPPETLPGGGAHLLLRPGANGNLDQIRQYGGLDTPITILSEPVADVDQREDLKALTLQLGASLVYADLPA